MSKKRLEKKGPPLRMYLTHVTNRGQVYIPRQLGGVEFSNWLDANTGIIKLTSKPYKQMLYIGIAQVRNLDWAEDEATKQALLIISSSDDAGCYRLEIDYETR